jgi:hypothetical protein
MAALKLQMVAATVHNGAGQPMTRNDRFDDVLDAFASDFAPEDLSSDELDQLYSAALSEGVLSEADVNSSFEAFLDREVSADSSTGELSLAPFESPTVGSVVQAYREQRSMTMDELARDNQLTVQQVQLLERCTDRLEPDRVADVSRTVATRIGIPVPRLHTLLQNVRATLELKSARGPTLMAARTVPPK